MNTYTITSIEDLYWQPRGIITEKSFQVGGICAETFWSRVNVGLDHECWDWAASTGPDGYGYFYYNRKAVLAHRAAWSFTNHAQVPVGQLVIHKCGMRKCVNPAHLKLGTRKDAHKPLVRDLEYYLARIVNNDNGCWEWQGCRNKFGYGVHKVDETGRSLVHRATYELLIGPIPDNLVIDHLCNNKCCCNPEHLEAVTNAVNVSRAQSRKTHCKRGHPLSGNNIDVFDGRRCCKACRKKAAAQYRMRKRLAA